MPALSSSDLETQGHQRGDLQEIEMVKTSQLLKQLQERLAELEARNEKLEARVRQLEQPANSANGKADGVAAPVRAPAPVSEPETITEETMLVIAAAVAAFLGERAHIRVVRLTPSHAWTQQGRVSIQASHRLL